MTNQSYSLRATSAIVCKATLYYIPIVNARIVSGPIISRFMAHSDGLAPRDARNSCTDHNRFFIIHSQVQQAT